VDYNYSRVLSVLGPRDESGHHGSISAGEGGILISGFRHFATPVRFSNNFIHFLRQIAVIDSPNESYRTSHLTKL
jgi:hypothetical protein